MKKLIMIALVAISNVSGEQVEFKGMPYAANCECVTYVETSGERLLVKGFHTNFTDIVLNDDNNKTALVYTENTEPKIVSIEMRERK